MRIKKGEKEDTEEVKEDEEESARGREQSCALFGKVELNRRDKTMLCKWL